MAAASPTILEMGTYTRLDCVIGSAGMMRQAVVQALHHAQHRRAFGARLIEQPLMRSVLADLVLESEAATALALRLARAFDSERQDEIALRRALTPAAKFWVCKRGCELAAEAMEVLGGNGYTEELPLARMVREMPVNSIWEGSGNIMCLDVLRAFGKSPATCERVLAELAAARGRHRDFDAAFERFAAALEAQALTEAHARHLAQAFATLMQASLLLEPRHRRRAGYARGGRGVLRDPPGPRCGMGRRVRRERCRDGCRGAAAASLAVRVDPALHGSASAGAIGAILPAGARAAPVIERRSDGCRHVEERDQRQREHPERGCARTDRASADSFAPRARAPRARRRVPGRGRTPPPRTGTSHTSVRPSK